MKRFLNDLKKYWRYIIYAGQTELRAEVANSYLNWLWWIIEPMCFMFIYSLVFGILFGSKEEHFNCFVFIGITMWDFFSRMATSSVQVVRNNKPIVSRVYIPKYTLIFVKLYVNAFKMLICFVLLFIMMLVTGVEFTWNILWMFPTVLAFFTLTFGICTLLMHFGVFVDDLANVTRIFLRMMFYLTGVFYNLESRLGTVIGAKYAGWIGHINPVASLIKTMRDCVLYGNIPDVRFITVWFLIGLALSVLGVMLVYKNENTYVKVI